MVRAWTIFAMTYVLLNAQRSRLVRLDRPVAAPLGAALMVVAGVITPDEAYRAIEWNTIVLLRAMFLLAGCLRRGGFFEWAADLVRRHPAAPRALLSVVTFLAGLPPAP